MRGAEAGSPQDRSFWGAGRGGGGRLAVPKTGIFAAAHKLRSEVEKRWSTARARRCGLRYAQKRARCVEYAKQTTVS